MREIEKEKDFVNKRNKIKTEKHDSRFSILERLLFGCYTSGEQSISFLHLQVISLVKDSLDDDLANFKIKNSSADSFQ